MVLILTESEEGIEEKIFCEKTDRGKIRSTKIKSERIAGMTKN
jgi:hypothetical protein